MKTIFLEYLKIPIEVSDSDEWFYMNLVKGQYNVHYCEDYHEICIYEYDEQLDEPENRYKLLSKQII